MSKQIKPVPEFKSEADERAFWESPENDSSQYLDWRKAQAIAFPNLRASTKTISLRIPESLLNRIRARANKLDVPYQSLMKIWLSEKATEAETNNK